MRLGHMPPMPPDGTALDISKVGQLTVSLNFDLLKTIEKMYNYNFCLNQTVSDIFSQKCTLELFNNPLTMCVLSPSNNKYFGSSALVLFHLKLKS